MTTAADWSRAADTMRRIGHSVEYHAAIGSTNDRARAALAEPDGEGRAIVADLQTSGRGRRGRTWLSPAGLNLMVSVALRPHLDASRAGLLGIAAALAARDACQALTPGASFGVRWPNDVVTDQDLKVAGLLLETSLSAGELADAVVGIGINVNWRRRDMPSDIGGRATSLADLAGAEVDRVALLGELLLRLDQEVEALESGGSPVGRYREASSLDGRRVTVDLGETQVEGIAAGVTDEGALLLDATGGRVALSIGEVAAVRDAEELAS